MGSARPPGRIGTGLQRLTARVQRCHVRKQNKRPRLCRPRSRTRLRKVTRAHRTTPSASRRVSFLSACHADLGRCLKAALHRIVTSRISRLHRHAPPRSDTCIRNLCLHRYRKLTVKTITPHVNLDSRIRIAQLLGLGQLQTRIHRQLVPSLRTALHRRTLGCISTSQLGTVSRALRALLTRAMSSLVTRTTTRTRTPRTHPMGDHFDRRLYARVRTFLPPRP